MVNGKITFGEILESTQWGINKKSVNTKDEEEDGCVINNPDLRKDHHQWLRMLLECTISLVQENVIRVYQ